MTLGDRYVVGALIGEGKYAATYAARDLTLSRNVAVKTLQLGHGPDSEPAARLRREARVASSLRHPEVCEVSDLGALDDGTPYIVMERLTGETLADKIAREGALAVADVVDIVLQTTRALGVAHERGIVHRDVRPQKVFLRRRPAGCAVSVKLLDFGVAKIPDDRDPSPDPRRSLTPYTSPEQALGKHHDVRADVWSCGAALYQALTGECPFTAPTHDALIREILGGPKTRVRALRHDAPRALECVIERAMSVEPRYRQPSVAELASELRRVRVSLADEAGEPPATASSR